jgi:hypothetical protein
LVLFLAGCTADFTSADTEAIRDVMAMQEAAWDRGDIPGFMEGYSDTVCFISKRGVTCGREAVTANYLRSYPDKEARAIWCSVYRRCLRLVRIMLGLQVPGNCSELPIRSVVGSHCCGPGIGRAGALFAIIPTDKGSFGPLW